MTAKDNTTRGEVAGGSRVNVYMYNHWSRLDHRGVPVLRLHVLHILHDPPCPPKVQEKRNIVSPNHRFRMVVADTIMRTGKETETGVGTGKEEEEEEVLCQLGNRRGETATGQMKTAGGITVTATTRATRGLHMMSESSHIRRPSPQMRTTPYRPVRLGHSPRCRCAARITRKNHRQRLLRLRHLRLLRTNV